MTLTAILPSSKNQDFWQDCKLRQQTADSFTPSIRISANER